MARKRPKMPPALRRLVYSRDNFACRRCGWTATSPANYDGRNALCAVVGTRRRLIRFVPSFTDKPEVREYRDEDVLRWLVIDHIVPISAGGKFSDPDNLQTLCSPCNGMKGARV